MLNESVFQLLSDLIIVPAEQEKEFHFGSTLTHANESVFDLPPELTIVFCIYSLLLMQSQFFSSNVQQEMEFQIGSALPVKS